MEKLEAPSSGVEDLLPRLKDDGYSADRVARRREWVEKKTGARLQHIGSPSFDTEVFRGNIENPIGVAQVPMGVAGPVQICGQYAQGVFYVPMATSEGALLRSYERGMVALTRAGGVQTAVQEDENDTVPSFFFNNIREAAEFCEWVPRNLAGMQAATATTTRHGKLNSAYCYQSGRQVMLHLAFHTGDAHGMNMIMKATDAVCRWINQNHPTAGSFLFSGMCSEKKASSLLLTRGKGKRVIAGAFLPDNIMRMYLHVSADQMMHMWQSTIVGHLHAGAVGFNGHVANGLTAIFIATGQDVANVVNSACAVTYFEYVDGGLHVSVTLPSLTIATVGGGTNLPTPREALGIMDCVGTGKARKFAEIIAAAVLGGEISIGAAIASDEFVKAHEHYGRNRPK